MLAVNGENISRSFPLNGTELKVLKNIDLKVAEGECVAIIGEMVHRQNHSVPYLK